MRELTDRQRTALWLRAQGLTAAAIGRQLNPPVRATGAQDLLVSAYRNLGAKDSLNAVYIAVIEGVIGPHLDCGTRSAYLRHLRNQESACIACRKANTAYVRNQKGAPARPGPARSHALSPRQIDALRAIQNGARTGTEVARIIGVDGGTARRMILKIMERLDVDLPGADRAQRFKAAVERGIERGYLTS